MNELKRASHKSKNKEEWHVGLSCYPKSSQLHDVKRNTVADIVKMSVFSNSVCFKIISYSISLLINFTIVKLMYTKQSSL